MVSILGPLLLAVCGQTAAAAPPADRPRVTDPRLKLELFAESPDLVTPVGLDVDSLGRVLVVESHTHFPPPNYTGPKADRIRMFVDADRDGRAEKVTNFYEGLKFTMNLAVYHDGSVYVATRSEIFRLRDTNDDGVADERTPIAHLETAGNYPHNGLSGFAFDFAGDIYFGFGENLGADYKLVGADGKTLSGGGEGGNIYACDAEGKNLRRVATGFWNPFHLNFDAFGRLFTVDNDPDSRPPCRLLHIVDGGDYGYRFRNGRRGTHPFTAWNGELPGTLPMTSGTGEAPSGIVAYESDNLPEDYRGDLLVTSWGDHRLDRFRLRPRGASFVGDSTPVLVGGENFRPVGVVVAPDGSVFISDWVDKSYELHGKGRLWRLSRVNAAHRTAPASPLGQLLSHDRKQREAEARRQLKLGEQGFDRLAELLDRRGGDGDDPRSRALAVEALASAWPRLDEARRKLLASRWTTDPSPDVRAMALALTKGRGVDLPTLAADNQPALVRAAALRLADPQADRKLLFAQFDDADPFIRQAALSSVLRGGAIDEAADFDKLPSAGQRLAVALALRERGEPAARSIIPRLLRDDDAAVRFVGVQWIGEENLSEHRDALRETLQQRANTRLLFEGCLAALERLDGVARRPTDEWRGEQYVLKVLLDPATRPEVRRRALRTLRPTYPEMTIDILMKLFSQDDAALRLEVIRTLREHPSPKRYVELLAIINDPQTSDDERTEAIMGLDANDPAGGDNKHKLLEFATKTDGPMAIEALRGLRGVPLDDAQALQLAAAAKTQTPAWKELAKRIVEPVDPARAAEDVDAWLGKLEGPADAAAGERIFFHRLATQCYRCHEYDGRGAGIGPELTQVTRTMTRRRLVESLVDPSREIAPQFVPWLIETQSGKLMVGMLAGEEVDGTQRYVDEQGREFRLKPAEIAQKQPHNKSIMPDGLPALLTTQEFRDLVAFLLKK